METKSSWIQNSFNSVWGKFLWYLLGNTVLSLGIGLAFFRWFGHEIHFGGYILEKEYFDAVCGVFAIIGLGIAIFQLAALKREEEVIAKTTIDIHVRHFTAESKEPVSQAIALVTDLKNLIINDDLGPITVTGFQNKVSASLSILQRIDSQQDSIGCDAIINSKNCVTLLEELQGLFLQLSASKKYVANKQEWIAKVDKLLKALEECLAMLQKQQNAPART